MAVWGAVAKMGAGMLKGRKKKQTGAQVAAKVTGKSDTVYSVKANPNATSSELDAKKIIPATPDASGGSKSFKTDKEAALHIKRTTIEVATLLKGSLVLDKMRAKDKKKTQQQLKRTKAEDQLEKDNKGKFKFPIPGAKKVKSLWERIKKFFLTVFLGFIAIKLAPLVPHLIKALPLIAKVADFVINLGIGIVDVLSTAIKIGYDAYDWTRKQVKDKLGEGAAENFDSFMGGLNKVINATIALGLLAAKVGGGPQLPGGKPKGSGADLDVDPKTKRKLDADEIYDTKTKKPRKKTQTEIDVQKKNNWSNKELDQFKQKKTKINPKTGKKFTTAEAIADVKKPKGFAKWLQKGKELGGKGLRLAGDVGKSGLKLAGTAVKGALNLLPNFNKLGDELGGILTDQYKNISARARKQYDNVVGLATKLKGKWDNALGAAGNAFNKMKEGAKQKIMEKVLEPVMKFLEPLKKKLGAVGKRIVGVLEGIPGFDKVMQVLKKNGVSSLGDAKGILKKVGGKAIPVIGGIINLAFAYDRLAGGDTVGGLLEGASGVLDLLGLVPGFQWGPGVSMGIDAYMFARDFVPQLKEGEDAAIAGVGLTGLQNDMDKMFASLPDLGTITKMITGGDKEKKEPVAGAGSGESKGAPLGETSSDSAQVTDDLREGGDDQAVTKGAVKDQEKKLLATNQQSGAQGVIDSISTRASYEDGAPETIVVDSGSGGGGGVQQTGKSSSPPLVTSGGGGSDPYESLYKGG